jgi:hypothetical protein
MSTSSIPTRANLQTIDQTWFNIIQNVLGVDFVPRNASGVAVDLAGNMGTLTFAWAALYAAALQLRSNGNTAGLVAPAGLAASYQLTMPPALPASASRLIVDALGNMTFSAGASAVSSLSASNPQRFTSTTLTDVTNLSVTITASGRPILLTLLADQNNSSGGTMTASNRGSVEMDQGGLGGVFFVEGSTVLGSQTLQGTDSVNSNPIIIDYPASSFSTIVLAPSAGSHTYKVQGACFNPGRMNIYQCKLLAMEL